MIRPVAVYARHSDRKQVHSTMDQIARCEDYCRSRGYLVVSVFRDEAISGAAVVNRPGMGDLMDAAAAGLFERVIAEDLSRFSRDQCDIANLYKTMAFLDIALETVHEGSVNELHIGLKGTMNALYLKDLADKTRRGQFAAVRKGRIQGGRLYGYRTEHRVGPDGKAVRGFRAIDADEAAVVGDIFRRYVAGQTLAAICDILNDGGVAAPFGGIWRPASLVGTAARNAGLLRQTLYKGEYTFNKIRYVKDPKTGKRQARTNPRTVWIAAPVPELAIVDAATFEAAQTEIKRRSRSRRETRLVERVANGALARDRRSERARRKRAEKSHLRANRLYLFSGKLRCALHPGERITVVGGDLHCCGVRSCRHWRLRRADIQRAVYMALDGFDAAAVEEAVASFSAERGDLEARVAAKRAERAALTPKIERLVAAIDGETPLAEIREAVRAFETGKLEKRLRPIAALGDGEAERIVAAYRKAVAPLYAEAFDQRAIVEIFPWFSEFHIDSDRDGEGNLKLRCSKIVWDWRKMFEALRGSNS